MGIPLTHSPEGKVGWFGDVDGNWTTLETQDVARQKSDTGIVTVTGVTAETALMANTTIPANALAAGAGLSLWAAGSVTVAANTTPSFTFRLRWGGISGTVLSTWTWGPYGTSGTAYSFGWIFDHRLVCISAGASGSGELDGWMAANGCDAGLTTGHGTIDTTTSKNLLLTVQPS